MTTQLLQVCETDKFVAKLTTCNNFFACAYYYHIRHNRASITSPMTSISIFNCFLVVTRLTRRVPSQYEDGVYQPSGFDRPNPFTLSKELMNGNSSGCVTNKNVLLVFFGK